MKINNYKKQWEFLKNKFEAGQLAHAYLLSGRDVESVQFFAKEFVKLVNCLPTGDHSQGDKMIDKENFPDLKIVKSINSESSVKNEKDMMSIEIKQIREVQNFLSYKSYYGSFKSVIIENAERMTLEAQNCFLKNLEEPKGKTIIFLISSKSEMLLPTIFSRCQSIFFKNSRTDAELYADLRGNDAMRDLLNVINLDLSEKFKYTKAVNLEGDNFNKILNGLQRHFRNLLLAKIGVECDANILMHTNNTNNDYSIEKLKKIIRLIDDLNYQSNISNINNKLALEVILLEI